MQCMRYSRILDLSTEILRTRRQVGSVAQITEGPAVIARMRSVSATVAFMYRDVEIVRLSSWVSIDAASSEAKQFAKTRRMGPDEPGEIVVDVVITERSVSLLEPDSFSTTLTYLDGNHDVTRAIEAMHGHQPLETSISRVWTSLSTEEANWRRVSEVQDTFLAKSLPANTFMHEARKRFQAIRRSAA